ncbi:MAG: hypothetical protein P4L84_37695 [Isosphaeraceae bacterium]|nr:hypothetical protein [Isosphaeraceae bacterium]
MSATPICRIRTSVVVLSLLASAGSGCQRSPTRLVEDDEARQRLPPAYTRDKIIDPTLAEAAQRFGNWAEAQNVGGDRIFLRAEILPPAPTLLPYGIGTYQKEWRLPAILITGPGWSSLKPASREAIAAGAFRELSSQLATAKTSPPVLPSVTIQTPQGLELAWINQLEPGETLLHGEDN